MTTRQKSGPSPGSPARDGPLVSLDGARFRVAVEMSGRSLHALARAASEGRPVVEKSFRQTLHHHYQGKGKRIRAAVRSRLAAVLAVPEDWLAGVEVFLPYGVFVGLADPVRRSVRVSCAVARLVWPVLEAVAADVGKEPVRRPTPDGFDPAVVVLSAMAHTLMRCLTAAQGIPKLMNGRWLLYAGPGNVLVTDPPEPLPFESPPLVGPARDPLPAPVEHAYLAAVDAVQYLLDPWLRGAATLDYAALLDLAESVRPGGKSVFPPTMQHATAEDLAEWATTASTSPYALLDWPAMEHRLPQPPLASPPPPPASPPQSPRPSRRRGPRSPKRKRS